MSSYAGKFIYPLVITLASSEAAEENARDLVRLYNCSFDSCNTNTMGYLLIYGVTKIGKILSRPDEIQWIYWL